MTVRKALEGIYFGKAANAHEANEVSVKAIQGGSKPSLFPKRAYGRLFHGRRSVSRMRERRGER